MECIISEEICYTTYEHFMLYCVLQCCLSLGGRERMLMSCFLLTIQLPLVFITLTSPSLWSNHCSFQKSILWPKLIVIIFCLMQWAHRVQLAKQWQHSSSTGAFDIPTHGLLTAFTEPDDSHLGSRPQLQLESHWLPCNRLAMITPMSAF